MNKRYSRITLLFSIFICTLLLTSISFAAENDTPSDVSDNAQHIEKISTNENNKIIDKKENTLKTSVSTANNYNELATQIKSNENKTINLVNKKYDVTSSITVRGNNNITINGNNAVLDGKNRNVFFLDYIGNKLTINNLTICNMKTANNAALILAPNGEVVLENCKFINITGESKGGAIKNRKNLVVKNCLFENNIAPQGAALWLTGNSNTVDVINSTFKNNPVKVEKAPLIFIGDKQNVTIDKCTFENNQGRSIHAYKDSNTTIINSKFINMNHKYTTNVQGAIFDNYEAKMTVKNNTFKNITVTAPKIAGGIVYNEIGIFNVDSNNFTNIKMTSTGNKQIVAGGLIWNRNSTTNITNNIFDVECTGYDVRGGAVYNNIGNISLLNNKFNVKVNAAHELGGAAAFNDYDQTLKIKSILNSSNNDFSAISIKAASITNKTIRSMGILNELNLNKTAILTIKAPTSIATGQKVTFNITVTDTFNNPVSGKAIIKINGLTLKEKNTNIVVQINNGKGSLTYQLAGYSARTYTVAAVFSKTGYSRAENTTKMTITKGKYKDVEMKINASSEEILTINKTLYDTNGNQIFGVTKVAIKLGDRTVLTTEAINGSLYGKFKVPYLPPGENKFRIILGENYRYDVNMINRTATINKQDVIVSINNITAKTGDTIKLTAKLTNQKTKTNVLSGKYIFKVNGKTVPVIINNKEEFTTSNIVNATATGTYKLPSDMTKGVYGITLVYNGNTQSNAARYTSQSLTII